MPAASPRGASGGGTRRGVALLAAASWLAAGAQSSSPEFHIGQNAVPEASARKDPSAFRVHPKHPRLFFRDTDLPALRARIAGTHADDWREMTRYLDGQLLKKNPAAYGQGSYLKAWQYGRNMAFAAAVSGEPRYKDWALRWALHMAAADPKKDDLDDHYRGRLMSLAVAYDWLHPSLTDPEKADLQKAILAHIERNWYFAEKPNFTGGHSRWGNFSLAAGLLAVVTERPEVREKLMRVRDNWVNGFHPAQGWIAADGGYHMGWTYSDPYTDADNHGAWSSATNECVFYPWRELLPYFFLYGNRGNGTCPNSGDAYDDRDSLNYDRSTLCVAAGLFKNRHARGMLDKKVWDRFYDILYEDKAVKPLAPDDPSAPLPPGRCFRNSGVVIARDRWDDRTTHLQFKSTPFYSANHHHRDENSFTLFYRGDLAIDSGRYDSYGSEHWANYMTRTVAHNAVTVFDPAQKFSVHGRPASNDGGQPYREEPAGLQDIAPGGAASLDGIVAFEHGDDFTYARGDATKAYDPSRVRLAQRDVVYLRKTARAHPVVVVFDRIESAKPEYEKRFLLHTVQKPAVTGTLCASEHGGGRLTSATLLPRDAQLELVGGPGKEFWAGGRNYPPPASSLQGKWADIAGRWRLEVSPGGKRPLDHFLHVLLVDDAGAAPVGPEDVRLVEGSGCVGAQAAGWTVVFPLAPAPAASIAYDAPGRGMHLVTGLVPGKKGTFSAGGGSKPVGSGMGGCARFQSERTGWVSVQVPR